MFILRLVYHIEVALMYLDMTQMPLKQRYFLSLNISGLNGFLSLHCIIRLGYGFYEHTIFFHRYLVMGVL